METAQVILWLVWEEPWKMIVLANEPLLTMERSTWNALPSGCVSQFLCWLLLGRRPARDGCLTSPPGLCPGAETGRWQLPRAGPWRGGWGRAKGMKQSIITGRYGRAGPGVTASISSLGLFLNLQLRQCSSCTDFKVWSGVFLENGS